MMMIEVRKVVAVVSHKVIPPRNIPFIYEDFLQHLLGGELMYKHIKRYIFI